MEDTKEKGIELNSEDLDKVSGGYAVHRIEHTNKDDVVKVDKFYCDVCKTPDYSQWWDSTKREDVKQRTLLIPFQGGHLCVNCLKRIEEELGRKIL